MYITSGRASRTAEHVKRSQAHKQHALVTPKAMRGCAGKIRHPSKKIAAAHARKRSIDDPKPLRAYSCRLCGGWHIGH